MSPADQRAADGELLKAANLGNVQSASEWLDKGANADAADESGRTPLFWAALKGHKDVAELLIANGADVNAAEEDGWTPLHAAVLYLQKKDMVELLIAKGANVNAADKDGRTLLHEAARRGHKNIVELLRKHGAK